MKLARVLALTAACLPASAGLARAQSASAPGVLPPPGASSPQLVPPATATEPTGVPTPPAYMAPTTGSLDSLLPPMTETLPAESPLEQPLPEGALASTITPTPMWYHPSYWVGEDPWTAGVEVGINGSQGNNDTFSMRAGGNLKRETKLWKFDSSLVYNKNNSNGVETQNNGKVDARADRSLGDSRWTLFGLENLIYDEFQAFDVQLALTSGVGYRLIDTEFIDLLTRFGPSATREFGGPDNAWKPTSLFGLDYNHQITKMQRAVAKVEYYPAWEDYRDYRVVSDLSWQIDLDRPRNVSLKLSAIDRYDSTPDGKKPNNLDYAVLLIWGL
jgi:putative salt-induced outer membrane protein YdiY